MTKKFNGKILSLFAILLLAPWPVAYAFDAEATAQGAIIEVAQASAAPSAIAFERAIGAITPGDLFYIDTTGTTADITATLHLTNTQELVHSYRYMTLKTGIYVQTDSGEWGKAATRNGELIPDTYITLRNGQVSFPLPGYAKYKVAIDSGSFYYISTNADGGGISPQFYLTVN